MMYTFLERSNKYHIKRYRETGGSTLKFVLPSIFANHTVSFNQNTKSFLVKNEIFSHIKYNVLKNV